MAQMITRGGAVIVAIAAALAAAGFTGQHHAAAQGTGRWVFSRPETVTPTPQDLGKHCRFGGDAGESDGAIGARFETSCFSPATGATTVKSGHADWHYSTVFDKAAGEFNDNLSVLEPGKLIGFIVNTGSTSKSNGATAWVSMSTTHPASGSVPVAAAPDAGPGARTSGKGYAKVWGKPRLLPDGNVPMLVLSYEVTGGNKLWSIMRRHYYRWEEGTGTPAPAPASKPAPAPAPPSTPAASPAPPPSAPTGKPASPPQPGTSAGCWERAADHAGISEVEPPGGGRTGEGSASFGSVSLRTQPSDPNWSHRVTAGVLTWSFSGGRPARLCAGSVLSGSVTFANPGVELGRAAYIPSGTMRVDLAGVAGAPRRAAQLFQLSSAELPAPGQQVSRTFSFTIPAGSAAVPELRIVAEVYGGRTARFTDVYRWTGR